MSRGIGFVAWVMEDTHCLNAEVGTPRDVQLKEFQAQGYLKPPTLFADTNSYEISSKGSLAYLPENQ